MFASKCDASQIFPAIHISPWCLGYVAHHARMRGSCIYLEVPVVLKSAKLSKGQLLHTQPVIDSDYSA